FPNAIAQVSEAVGQKRRSASNTEYHPIVGAGCDGAPRKIRDEEADDQRIGKPLPQELWHGGRSAGKHRQNTHRSLLVFFDHGGRLHLLVRAVRENVETPLQSSGAQGGKKFVFFGKLAVIAV